MFARGQRCHKNVLALCINFLLISLLSHMVHAFDSPNEEPPRQPPPDDAKEESGFFTSLLASLSVVFLSELGDKTFFIAAIMAMKEKRLIVLLSALSALVLMTILSVAFGVFLPYFLPRRITTILAGILFLVFGANMIKEYYDNVHEGAEAELAEVSAEIEEKIEQESLLQLESAAPVPRTRYKKFLEFFTSRMNPVALQTFSLTFLAEWGDRSQLATIALAASRNVYAVVIGAIIGHAVCTSIAVLGGRLIASKAAYLLLLCQELSNEKLDPLARRVAGLAVKNSLVAKDSYKKEMLISKWIAIDEAQKNLIRNLSVSALASEDLQVGTAAAQVIAAIANIELPRREWPEIIQILVQNVTRKEGGLKLAKASLEAIGFICEEIDPTVLEFRSNEILTAVCDGMKQAEPHIKLAATNALYNSLEFIGRNIENQVERNFIMQVVLEATQSAEEAVCVAAFECLVKLMQLYYSKMQVYMEKGLFQLTVSCMRHSSSQIALQAIEFWSTVCEIEIDIEMGDADDCPLFNFARTAMPEILPTLLQSLIKQEDDDDDDWNVSMAAGTCLLLLSQAVGDAIIEDSTHLWSFVEKNILSSDWKHREAAVMAFGSMLEGPKPETCAKSVQQAFPLFLNMMKDRNAAVRDTTAWTIGRIVDIMYETMEPSQLPQLIGTMCTALGDEPRVAANAAWCLMNLSAQVDDDEAEVNFLTPYFHTILQALFNATQRQDATNSNLRAASYQAIADTISHSAKHSLPVLIEFCKAILAQLTQTFILEQQIVSVEDRLDLTDKQANLCTIIQNIVKKLGPASSQFGDSIMGIFLKMFSTGHGKSTFIYEDVFLAIGALICAIEKDFGRYIDSFMPVLYAALQNYEEEQFVSIAIGIVGDLCRAFNQDFAPYCDTIMKLLLSCVQSPSIHRNVKPLVLSAFGDIAIAIGGNFEPFLPVTMNLLDQAQSLRLSPDELDYTHQLRESILEAYTCIINGLKTDGKAYLLAPYVSKMVSLVSSVYLDEDRTDILIRHSVGLLGDIAEALGDAAKGIYQNDWILTFISKNRSGKRLSESTKTTADWAYHTVKQLLAAK